MDKQKLEYPKKKKHERELNEVDEFETLGSADKRKPSKAKIRFSPFKTARS